MEKDLKDLLLKDLCGRLPYKVKIEVTYSKDSGSSLRARLCSEGINILDTNILWLFQQGEIYIKPYLFPLSSMTEEQKAELENLGWHFDNFEIHNVSEYLGTYREFVSHLDCFVLIDWLNKNNFDYRGLISKGLALDATGLNIY